MHCPGHLLDVAAQSEQFMHKLEQHKIGEHCALVLSKLLLRSVASSFPLLLLSLRDVDFESPSLLILTSTALRKFIYCFFFKVKGTVFFFFINFKFTQTVCNHVQFLFDSAA